MLSAHSIDIHDLGAGDLDHLGGYEVGSLPTELGIQ